MSSSQPTQPELSTQHRHTNFNKISPVGIPISEDNGFPRQNYIIVLGTLVSVFCAAGLATGFSSLKTILLKEQIFSYMCLNFNQQCQAQIIRLDLMYTLSGALGAFLVVPIGAALDKLGPKYLYSISSFILIVGLLLFALGVSLVGGAEDLTIFAFIIISVSGSALYTSSFHVANLFPKWSGMITLALNMCYDLSALVFTVVELIYSQQIPVSSRSSFIQSFFCGYTVPIALVFLFGLFYMPKSSVAWEDPNKEDVGMQPNYGLSIEHLQSQLINSPPQHILPPISTQTDEDPNKIGVICTHTHQHSHSETLQIGTVIDAEVKTSVVPALSSTTNPMVAIPVCDPLPRVSERSSVYVKINQPKLFSRENNLVNVSEIQTNKHASIAQSKGIQNVCSPLSKKVSSISLTFTEYREHDLLHNLKTFPTTQPNIQQKLWANNQKSNANSSDQHSPPPLSVMSKKNFTISPIEEKETKTMSMVKTGSSLQKRAPYREGISIKQSISSYCSPVVFSDAVPASIVQSMITHPYSQNESFDNLRLSASHVNVADEGGLTMRKGSFAIRPSSIVLAAASRSIGSATCHVNSTPFNATSANQNTNVEFERHFSKNLVQMDVYAPKFDNKNYPNKGTMDAVNWTETTNMCLTLDHIAIEKQYRSPFYWLFIAHTIINVLLLNFQIGSINNQITLLIKKLGPVGSKDLENSMLTAWSFILPIFGVAVSPLLIPLLQHCGYHSMFLTVSILSILTGIVSLIETIWSMYALMFLLSALKPVVWTVACNYIGKVFGFGSFGRLYGSLLLLVGVTNFIVFGFNIMSLKLESYIMANAIVLSLQLVSVVFPAILYGWQKGFKTKLVTIDDNSPPQPQY